MRLTSLVPRSLRARFLLVVGAGAVVPLAIVAMWLARAAERSAETLLRQRLDASLSQVVGEVGRQWLRRRSELLALADDSSVKRLIQSASPDVSIRQSGAPVHLRSDASGERAGHIVLRDSAGRASWALVDDGDSLGRLVPSSEGSAPAGAGVSVSIPVWSGAPPRIVGSLEAILPASALVPVGAGGTGGIGAVLAVVDRKSGVVLAPLPFDPALLDRPSFTWVDERWVVERRTLDEPAITLAATAPLGDYATPFEQAARRGAIAVLIVVAATLLVTTALTTRLTSSLAQLAVAADAVSAGALDRRVDDASLDEVGRVARAFNAMTENLRRTLAELSRREALAAVGGFAASLAHEVRNPLTAIRIDLQRVEEQIPADAPLRAPLGRALASVARLDQTVSSALRVARSSGVRTEPVMLAVPLERAMHASAPAFERAQGVLEPVAGDANVTIHGDADALEQLFLNLLLNAAQALPPGGRAGVVVSTGDGRAEVSVWDTGPGISADARNRVFEPFFSTKSDGTGLGLAIAKQIAIGHGGHITVDSEGAARTTFRVTLPLAPPA